MASAALTVAIAGCTVTVGSDSDFTPAHAGVLTVATEQVPKPGFWNGTRTRPTGGFEYELSRDLADRFGLDRVRIVVVPFDRIVTGHLGGADLAMSLITPTAEREQYLDFSAPYLNAPPTVLVKGDREVPDLYTARKLRWGAQISTTLDQVIEDEITPDLPDLDFVRRDRMLGALERGKVDAVLLDLPAAVAAATRSDGKLSVAAKLPQNEQIAAALPKGSGNVEAVSAAMRAFESDGTITDLLGKWVGPEAADPEDEIPLLRTTR